MTTLEQERDASTPEIARLKPYLVTVTKGKTYFWCACGRSRNQPFCDGSHRETTFQPLRWTAQETEEKLFCACKHTGAAPFCDGTHNRLSDTYAEADPADGADAKLVGYEPVTGGASKACLDNGCYVIRVPDEAMKTVGGMRVYPVIGQADGAVHISQYLAVMDTGESSIMEYPESDVVVFVQSGRGAVHIADRVFPVGPETGVCIKPGEGFRISRRENEPMVLSL